MKLFSVLKKDLMILVRNRAEMLVLFLMPLAFIIPISFALGAGDGYGVGRNNQMILLPVVDYDRGPRSQALLNTIGESLKLEKDYGLDLINSLSLSDNPDCQPAEEAKSVDNPACIELAAHAMLERSWRTAVLVIPKDFSKTVDAGEKAEVSLQYDPAGDAVQMQQIEGVIKGATIKLSLENQVTSSLTQLNDLSVFAPENVRQSLQAQVSTPEPKDQPAALRIEKVAPENFKSPKIPDTYQQTIPGYAVMYVFFIITTLSSSIRAERRNGTFRRLLSTPISRADLLGGKLLATVIIGLVQVLIMFAVGAILFKLGLGKDPLAFFLLTVTLVTTAVALGLAISTTNLGNGILIPPLIISALLGGCMFPLDLMPPFLRSLSVITPHSWALTGYQNLMVRGQGLVEVFPQIAVLAGFALLFFLIAVRRFNFEDQEAS
jgi:ABC-2 type transport system permease protein